MTRDSVSEGTRPVSCGLKLDSEDSESSPEEATHRDPLNYTQDRSMGHIHEFRSGVWPFQGKSFDFSIPQKMLLLVASTLDDLDLTVIELVTFFEWVGWVTLDLHTLMILISLSGVLE